MDSKDFPVKELSLLYLEHHHDNLNTPEDYVDEFKRVQQIMEAHLSKPEVSKSAPPVMRIQESYWHKA